MGETSGAGPKGWGAGKTTTIMDGSGVGAGGITRVLTELVRHWPAGQRIEVVAAPPGWQPSPTGGADVAVLSHHRPSRRETIMSAARTLRRATSRRARRDGTTRVLSLSPSLAIVGARLPVTTIVHDLAFRLWPVEIPAAVRRYRRVSYSVALRRSHSLVCVSARTRHDLFGLYGIAAEHSAVWVPGSSLDTVPGRVPAQLAGRRGPLLVIAGHAAHKGVELAIEALPALPGAFLAVLTGGERVDSLVERAGAVADRVCFLGRLSEADYAATIAAADVFLMPSHFEGYGLPAVEAIRIGTPTVISPDPALYEATGAAATRMTAWTAPALVRAVGEARHGGDRTPRSDVGRSWAEATEHLYDLLHTSA